MQKSLNELLRFNDGLLPMAGFERPLGRAGSG